MCVRVLWHCVLILEVHSSLLAVLATTACLLQSGAAAAASTANAETSTGIFNLYRQIFSTQSYFMRNRNIRLSSKNEKNQSGFSDEKEDFWQFLGTWKVYVGIEKLSLSCTHSWVYIGGIFIEASRGFIEAAHTGKWTLVKILPPSSVCACCSHATLALWKLRIAAWCHLDTLDYYTGLCLPTHPAGIKKSRAQNVDSKIILWIVLWKYQVQSKNSLLAFFRTISPNFKLLYRRVLCVKLDMDFLFPILHNTLNTKA